MHDSSRLDMENLEGRLGHIGRADTDMAAPRIDLEFFHSTGFLPPEFFSGPTVPECDGSITPSGRQEPSVG